MSENKLTLNKQAKKNSHRMIVALTKVSTMVQSQDPAFNCITFEIKNQIESFSEI